jgi:hypothetical protein
LTCVKDGTAPLRFAQGHQDRSNIMPMESLIFVTFTICVFGVAIAAFAYAQSTAAPARGK